ncbi:hypothetical protein ACF2JD_06755 [Aeromonas sp. A-5]|uniref:hypothetical protein n=1 Tax=Aeromonas ichthyocola TaxID=3367746 RepID=UPI0038EAFD09
MEPVFLEAMRGQAEERLRSDPQSALTRQLYQAYRTARGAGARQGSRQPARRAQRAT